MTARDLIRDLNRDLNLSRGPYRHLFLHGLARDIRDPSHNFINARDLDRDLRLADSLARARNIARGLARARRLDPASVRDLALCLASVRDLASDRSHRIDRVFHSTNASVLGLVHTRAEERARARELVAVVTAAAKTADFLIAEVEEGIRTRRAASAKLRLTAASSVGAVRLVRGAVRILPATHRRRYRDEFDSELYELTTAGASWWAQMGYAVRLLDRAWVLRAELREATAKRVPS